MYYTTLEIVDNFYRNDIIQCAAAGKSDGESESLKVNFKPRGGGALRHWIDIKLGLINK